MNTYAVAGSKDNVVFVQWTINKGNLDIIEMNLRSEGYTNVRKYVKANMGRWRKL